MAPTILGYLLVMVVVVVVITVFPMIVVVPVMFLIPVVIVFNTAAISFPIPCVISFSVVPRCNPVSSLVGRSSPIALMPLVMVSHWIPITLHPQKFRAWASSHNHDGRGRGWRRNYDSNGNLRVNCRACG